MLKNYLKSSKDYCPKFLIGASGSGKSYTLKKIFDDQKEKALLINEEGILQSNIQKSKVRIDFNNFQYIIPMNEKYRGSGNSSQVDIMEKIKEKNIKLLKFCYGEYNRLEKIKNKSKGQEKAKDILNIILSTYLNSINVILIDEPETYLDDYYLGVISKLIEEFSNSYFKVIISTHSSRLCELSNVELSNIYNLFSTLENGNIKYNYINLTIEDIVNKMQVYFDNVEKIRLREKHDIDKGINNKLNIFSNKTGLKKYLNLILKSEYFYKSLFYKNIFIVEGLTEKTILYNLKENYADNIFIFSADGKPFIHLFAFIFSSYLKNIRIIIDSDKIRKKINYKTSYTLTLFLNEEYKDKLVSFDPDLENYFKIDIEKFAKENHFPQKGWSYLKPLASKDYFEKSGNIEKILDKIK